MKKTNLIKKSLMQGLAAITFMLSAQNSEARWFGFANGNLEGAFRVPSAQFWEGNIRYTYYSDMRNFIAQPWGFSLKAIRTSSQRGTGHVMNTWKKFNGGWCITQSSTTGWDSKNAWSAFWTWDERLTGPRLELDIIELANDSSQWNAYYARVNNQLKGPKRWNPIWWRDTNRRHSCNWPKNTHGATFKITGPGVTKQEYLWLEGNNRDTNVHIRYSNRPWAHGGNQFGGW